MQTACGFLDMLVADVRGEIASYLTLAEHVRLAMTCRDLYAENYSFCRNPFAGDPFLTHFVFRIGKIAETPCRTVQLAILRALDRIRDHPMLRLMRQLPYPHFKSREDHDTFLKMISTSCSPTLTSVNFTNTFKKNRGFFFSGIRQYGPEFDSERTYDQAFELLFVLGDKVFAIRLFFKVTRSFPKHMRITDPPKSRAVLSHLSFYNDGPTLRSGKYNGPLACDSPAFDHTISSHLDAIVFYLQTVYRLDITGAVDLEKLGAFRYDSPAPPHRPMMQMLSLAHTNLQ